MEKMDIDQVNHNCYDENESADNSLSPEAPGLCESFRDPELLPRIGDQYQVEIPALMTRSAYLFLTECSSDETISPGTYHDFLVGLPISVMWINEEVKNITHKAQKFHGDLTYVSNRNKQLNSKNVGGMQFFSDDLEVDIESVGVRIDDGIAVGVPAMPNLQQEIKNDVHQNCESNGHMVPGSLSKIWSDVEEASFLLALYIFGKNLVQVKKFVESKKMGDILSYYYGKFYRSDRYQRWSEGQKIRSRRCIYGHKIFTGFRKQELLSRLLPSLSVEHQNSLQEASKTFGDGKMLLEEYVFILKAAVGLYALVEAVGIGKGKHDLTSVAMEQQKSSQAPPARPEIPVGKACSKLTPTEIIDFLTGGYRLSKARSSDLFWEAVWPLLLAKGWHSEQPKDASKNSLVFIIPGKKKFSRKKLLKGVHYFDSVSDVLNKVASDPMLLELDVELDKDSCAKEENGLSSETNSEQGDFPDHQRHHYLKPRTPSLNTDVRKFTIVDSSLAFGKTTRVRELRSLPVDLMNISISKTDSEENDGDSYQESTDESDCADNLCSDRNVSNVSRNTEVSFAKLVASDREDFESNSSKQGFLINGSGDFGNHSSEESFPVNGSGDSENNASKQSFPTDGSGSTEVLIKSQMDPKASKGNDLQPRNSIKNHAVRRSKTNDRNLLLPVAKRRRRLTACNLTERSHGTMHDSSKQDVPGCTARHPDFTENIFSHAGPPQEELLSISSPSRGSQKISDECPPSINLPGSEHALEKPERPRTLIDLNLPVPQDAETEISMVETTDTQHHQTSCQPEDPSSLKTSTSATESASEQPSNTNSRRHSTRNRPPTAKVLEALATGFLSVKQKRKSKDDFPQEKPMRPSRHAHSRVRTNEDLNTVIMDFKGDERENGACNNNGDMPNDDQV